MPVVNYIARNLQSYLGSQSARWAHYGKCTSIQLLAYICIWVWYLICYMLVHVIPMYICMWLYTYQHDYICTGLMITAYHQTFSSQNKHLSSQIKFGQTTLLYIINGEVIEFAKVVKPQGRIRWELFLLMPDPWLHLGSW